MAEQVMFISKLSGLKIVREPVKLKKDEAGNIMRSGGVYIKFNNGRYLTSDKDEIEYLNAYAESHKGRIYAVSKQEDALMQKVKAAVREVVGGAVLLDEEKIAKTVLQRAKKGKEVEALKESVEDEIFNPDAMNLDDELERSTPAPKKAPKADSKEEKKLKEKIFKKAKK